MNERLIAIGDIHGCREALEALIAAIKPGPDDTVVTLGDYVDRGPDSAGVIDTLLELGNRTQLISLIGNHEEMMLDVIRGHESHHNWLRYGGVETLDSYQFSGNLDFLPPEHEAFFNSLGDFYESENHFFVHACYDSKVPLADQPIDLLRWTSLREKMPQPHRNGKIAVVG
ncbi:MAG: metallophosphoesterase family protein, partial [Planctomycetota bacterium]